MEPKYLPARMRFGSLPRALSYNHMYACSSLPVHFEVAFVVFRSSSYTSASYRLKRPRPDTSTPKFYSSPPPPTFRPPPATDHRPPPTPGPPSTLPTAKQATTANCTQSGSPAAHSPPRLLAGLWWFPSQIPHAFLGRSLPPAYDGAQLR